MILNNQERVLREETRSSRYQRKLTEGISKYPVSLVGISFNISDNIGFLVRSAACFGAQRVIIIGSLPPVHELVSKSAATNRIVEILTFPNPSEYLAFSRKENAIRVAFELTPEAKDIHTYKFNTKQNTHIIVGNETTGVPGEILLNSDPVFIPMDGPGFCLNTSQTAHIGLYEYVRQTKI